MNNSENKICQNCKKDFIIEPDDFSFYEKMKVPPPTWCPECRLQRRLSWRNEWKLLRKKDIHGKEIFSIYHEDSPVKILETAEWYSDSWDPMEYGKDYDFSRPFFEQFKELLCHVPVMSRALIRPVRSDFSSNASEPKDCYLSFGMSFVENSAYSIWGAKSKDIFDCHMYNESELCYDSVNITKCYRTLYSVDCKDCNDIIFCKNCIGCNNCFGCVNIKNQEYCILNKKYSKEEYEKLTKQIKEQMSSIKWQGECGRTYGYGEFFPIELSPYGYNETVAQEYFPLSKEEALQKGYKWSDYEPETKYEFSDYQIPDNINDVDDSILKEVISCAHEGKCNHECAGVFRITNQELQFYKKLNIPLSQICQNCRHYARFVWRNPPKLWHRKCMKSGCANEFETSYAPDRPEIVYCEQCYQQEVA